MEIQALVIDDEPQCVEVLRKKLPWASLGVTNALGAYSAKEARRIMESREIQLILCDIEMPEESGLEFIEWVREQSNLNGANVECIILTCYPDYRFMRKAMQMGCSDYLIKPLDQEELESAVKKAVKKIQSWQMQEPAPGNELPSSSDIVEAKVIPFIQQHYTQPISVTEIAAYAALNPQYLMRLFKKHTGKSILEYVTLCRLEKAAELLCKTNYSVDRISDQVGYGSATYFIKQFKKQFGSTPREFRKSHFPFIK